MRLDRLLARILVAAIVMIAAYFAPSAAQAHAGHAQPALTAVTASDVLSATSDHMATTAAMVAEVKATQVAVDAADPETPAPTKKCNGVCCGSAMACCAPVFVTDVGIAVPLRTATRLAPIPDFLARPGTDPEALPKPPRTFA